MNQEPSSSTFRPQFIRTRSKNQMSSSSYINHNYNDDQTVQTVGTVGTMGTNGTRHRRTNSTATFTSNSLAHIFEQQQVRERKLGISPSYEVVPETIQKVRRPRENNDDESLISPLADDDNNSFFRSDETAKSSYSLLDDWCQSKVAKRLVLPPEPNGTYMPKSSLFKEHADGSHGNCCLEGWVSLFLL